MQNLQITKFLFPFLVTEKDFCPFLTLNSRLGSLLIFHPSELKLSVFWNIEAFEESLALDFES